MACLIMLTCWIIDYACQARKGLLKVDSIDYLLTSCQLHQIWPPWPMVDGNEMLGINVPVLEMPY